MKFLSIPNNNVSKKNFYKFIIIFVLLMFSLIMLVTNWNKYQECFDCNSDECLEGCKAPVEATGDCSENIFKYESGVCYKSCPYYCSNMGTCRYNNCCSACGMNDIIVDCSTGEVVIESEDPTQAMVGISYKEIDGFLEGDGIPFGYYQAALNTQALQMSVIDQDNTNMTSNNFSYVNNNNICKLSLSGVFNDCGPMSYNEWLSFSHFKPTK